MILAKTLSTGDEMPVLGLGTWQLVGQKCVRAVKTALSLGYTHIDTAEIYDNEEAIGEAIKGVDRENLWITSKAWRTNLHRGSVVAACDATLKRLGTDYLDLYLVHWPNNAVDMEETFAGMKELVDAGKVRNVGVSNFTQEHLAEAMEKADVPITVNQVEYHALLDQEELRAYCDEHDVVLEAYAPLGHGELVEHPVLSEVGEHHGASAAQVAIAWLLQKGLVTIPKASTEEHQAANLEALDIELSDEEVARIDEMNRNERFFEPGFAEF